MSRIATIVAVAALAACGGKKSNKGGGNQGGGDPFEWAPAAGAGALTVQAGGEAGTVSGKVRYEGPAVSDTVDRNAAGCGGSVPNPILRVDAGALQGAVVWVAGAQGEVAPADVKLTQKACLYEPPVSVGAVGSRMIIGNDDSLLHNIHGYQWGDGLFNKPSAAGEPATASLEAAGVVTLKCDVHPWMLAHVLAFDHPYYALVDAAGAFSFAAPPPGTYELVVWHAKLGVKRAPIEVAAGGGLTVDAVYP